MCAPSPVTAYRVSGISTRAAWGRPRRASKSCIDKAMTADLDASRDNALACGEVLNLGPGNATPQSRSVDARANRSRRDVGINRDLDFVFACEICDRAGLVVDPDASYRLDGDR